MLKPAILYKEIVEKIFAEYLYSDDYFWYSGYGTCNELPNIDVRDGKYQWAIVDSHDNVLGYLAYQIQSEVDTVCNFGLFSFDRGNPLIGHDLFEKMQELVEDHRRLEWRMIGGNPVKKHYDKFCKKYNGNCVCLHSVTKDLHGNWHDEYIYEVMKS